MIQQQFIWYSSVGLIFLIEMYKHACIILDLSDQMNENCDSCIAGFCSSAVDTAIDALRFRQSPVTSIQNAASWGYFNTVEKTWNRER